MRDEHRENTTNIASDEQVDWLEGTSGVDAAAAVAEALNNLEGVLAVLEDVKDQKAEDPRVHACVAALQRTREVLEPVPSLL